MTKAAPDSTQSPSGPIRESDTAVSPLKSRNGNTGIALRRVFSAAGVSWILFTAASAGDWGAYHIVSASSPEFVLEAVDGVKEGATISIQKPNGGAYQKWIVNEEETRMQVLMPAIRTGSSTPSGGQEAGSATTRRKK